MDIFEQPELPRVATTFFMSDQEESFEYFE
jgi:hypothetical protein